MGFKVIAATADGASPNRSFFKLHSSTEYKTLNPYPADERYIYFFSDPPHLLKTTRNCLASKNRCLKFEDKAISWSHVVDLYYRNSTTGLSIVPKLKYEHKTTFSKMRVDLAAQAEALWLTGGEGAQETAQFIEIMDRFFDCMNVNNFVSGKHKRKPFQYPYRSASDIRIKENEFLKYLDDWEKSVSSHKELSATERNKMLLSDATRKGLKFTVKSFIDMVKYLFTLPDVKCFLSERISQDPLEKFFGCQRQRGGVNENPNVQEFCQNTQALRVINGGNCRGNKGQQEIDNIPLHKRKAASRTQKEGQH